MTRIQRIFADKSQESKRKISGNPSNPRYPRSISAKLTCTPSGLIVDAILRVCYTDP
jgi:hypothetical protein